MTRNEFGVRFYLRPKEKDKLNTPTAVLVRCWVYTQHRYLRFTTPLMVTPLQWDKFDSCGVPTKTDADPKIANHISTYRNAINYVLAAATLTGYLGAITSAELKTLTEGILLRMRLNQLTGTQVPLTAYTAPISAEIAKQIQQDIAEYNAICEKQCITLTAEEEKAYKEIMKQIILSK